MDSITYKAYKESDWNGICAVFAQASLEEVKGCCDSRAVRPLEFYPDSRILRTKCSKVCAWDGGELIGYIAYSLDELILMSLYVLPNYMGKGIGRTLLRIGLNNMGVNIDTTLLPEGIEKGVIKTLPTLLYTKGRTIKVICMTNNLRAVRLYTSEGFKPVCVYKDLLNGYLCFYTRMSLELKGGLIGSKSNTR